LHAHKKYEQCNLWLVSGLSLLPQSAGSVAEQTGLDANMPDICIVYQLHLECGRLINLYDWLQVWWAG